MSRASLALSCLSLCCSMAISADALAYCRTTTCRPNLESCEFDAHGCNQSGFELFWKDGEVRLELASEASSLRGITAEDFEAAASAAADAWQSATCEDGRKPALRFAPVVLAQDLAVEFLEDEENESVVVFRDDAWPHERNAVAKTQLGFYLSSGQLDDADVELNSAQFAFGTDEQSGDTDLQAVLTHEFGHVLGLDHTDVAGATMKAETTGSSTEALRTLEEDDVNAICAAYPPLEEDGEGDVTNDGGCSVAGPPGHVANSSVWFAVAGAFAAWMSRRRHRSAAR